jgi:hypothetical protein
MVLRTLSGDERLMENEKINDGNSGAFRSIDQWMQQTGVSEHRKQLGVW